MRWKVEPATNIGDDPGVGIALPHEDNLPLQVVSLLGGTDPAVADGFGRNSPSAPAPGQVVIQHVEHLHLQVGPEGIDGLQDLAPGG